MAHDCLAKVLEWNQELQRQLKVKDEFLRSGRQLKDVLEDNSRLRGEIERCYKTISNLGINRDPL